MKNHFYNISRPPRQPKRKKKQPKAANKRKETEFLGDISIDMESTSGSSSDERLEGEMQAELARSSEEEFGLDLDDLI